MTTHIATEEQRVFPTDYFAAAEIGAAARVAYAMRITNAPEPTPDSRGIDDTNDPNPCLNINFRFGQHTASTIGERCRDTGEYGENLTGHLVREESGHEFWLLRIPLRIVGEECAALDLGKFPVGYISTEQPQPGGWLQKLRSWLG